MGEWDPFKDFFSIQERVNRLFEDASATDRSSADATVSGTWSPVVDIYETDNEFVVMAETPEVEQPDINIVVEGNTLTIEGERRLLNADTGGYHSIERAYGRFSRAFLLPCSVDQESIKAALKDGVLRITLPKKKEIVPRHIEITGG